jgi:hypothetical protein
VADVWLASLRVHQGRTADALEALTHVGDDDVLPHPFALSHALFARCMAHGLAGRLADASTALSALDRAVERLGPQGRRFAPVAVNVRSWLLRATGAVEQADALSGAALELATATAFEEPRSHARLDLAEGLRRAGDPGAAADVVDAVASSLDDDSTMAWHVRQRVLWLRGRLALAAGDADRAAELAASLVADADGRGAARYALLGRHLAGLATPGALTAAGVEAMLADLDAQAGLDAWWLAAELALALGRDDWRAVGEERAARLVATGGPDVDRDAMARWLARGLDRVAADDPAVTPPSR